MITVSVFFDFLKTFDRVDHFLLIEKLKILNFSESVLHWIHSYLTERTQAVKDCIEGTISSSSPVRVGVPQDSVLGPLLFTLYLAEFSHVVKHCKYNFYADDLQAYIHCEPRDLSDTIRKVNEDIDAILDTDMTTEQDLRLYRAVNACVRFIFNVRTDEHITPYYVRLRWLKVDARRAYFVGCLLYKILQTKQPSLLHSNFNCKNATSNRATRAPRDMLFLPQCRTELYKQSFRLISARFWNGLSQSIRSATTLADFKQKLYCASS
ncbi:hypothetical protein ACFW04_014432 [Cataglyphis niger]